MAIFVGRIFLIAAVFALSGRHVALAQSSLDVPIETGDAQPESSVGDVARAETPPPPPPSLFQLPGTTPPLDAEGRACPGCPPRRIGSALLWVTAVNGMYELANLIRGQDTAKITPETWWTNMKRGWEWDLDDFAVNQIGHPYQGNNYFTTGRYKSTALQKE